MRRSGWVGGRSGVSLVEVLVSLLIFGSTILALTTAGVISGKQLRMSRSDVGLWAAVHSQLDSLSAAGYDQVTAGTRSVSSYQMSWVVQGTNPKKIILVAGAPNSRAEVVPDTFVAYVADWSQW